MTEFLHHKLIFCIHLGFICLDSLMDENTIDDPLRVVPLHNFPDYKEQCCKLINSEWTRSPTARMRTLNSSCDKLPTNLILIKGEEVIGHCKLTRIPSIHDACFVETVVIQSNLRNKGYGRYLMEETEKYCREFLKLNHIYLSTKGQEDFYLKLGYEICAPISIYGANFFEIVWQSDTNESENQRTVTNLSNKVPKPPPLPKLSSKNSYFYQMNNGKTFMKKFIL